MGSVLLYVLPLGLAVAISVFPTLAAIILLLGARPVPAGVGYFAGWSLGLLALVTFFSLSARLLPSGGDRMPWWTHAVEIAFGALLWAYLNGQANSLQINAATHALHLPIWALVSDTPGY